MTRAGAGYLRCLRDDRSVYVDAERLVNDCLTGYDLETEASNG